MNEVLKICTSCRAKKKLADFHSEKNSKDGKRANCKICQCKYRKKYRESNRQKVKEQKHVSYLLHREKNLVKNREYYLKNKKHLDEQCLRYREKHRGNLNLLGRIRYLANRGEKIREVSEYYVRNREIINKRRLSQITARFKIDPAFKMRFLLRRRLLSAIKTVRTTKKSKTMEYVGCTKEKLVEHMESTFLPGMTWENHGEWHIDHKIPMTAFDLAKESEIYKAMNYTNLQALWAVDNIRKSNKINI